MGQWVGYPARLRRNAARKYRDAVADARDKLRIGQQYRSEKREGRWERSEMQYEGDHWNIDGAPDNSSDLIVVNMSLSTANVIQPYMTGSEPRFIVEPFSGDASMVNASLQQALLNRLWRSHEVAGQEHLEVAASDFIIYGDGFLKCGYDIETIRTSEQEWQDVAKLWIQRVDPWDIWIDPSSNGLHDARWMCQRLRLTRQELEDSRAYFNTDEENVSYGKAALRAEDDQRSLDSGAEVIREVFDGSEWADVYEFYDLVHNRLIAFSSGELPIRWVDDIGGAPIVQMGNYRIPRSPYHFGELEPIWELQAELNKTRSHLITHRRRQAAKVFAKRDALGTDAIAALQSSVVMDVAFVDGDQPLDQLVRPVEIPNLDADIYNVSELMQADIYEISGVNEDLRGAAPEIRRTATEASIIEGASNVKSQYKLRQVEKASAKLGTIMLATARDVFPKTAYDEIQLFLTGRDADKINRAKNGELMAGLIGEGVPQQQLGDAYNALPADRDVVMSPSEDIFTGSYEVTVEQHSTELRNPQLKEQKYRQMTIDIVQLMEPLRMLGVNVNVKRLMEMWFEAAGIDDVDSMFEGGMGMGMPGMEDPTGGQLDPSMISQLMAMNPQGLSPENTGALPPQV